jgi:phosphoglycerate dehydrogenase-like enzyme
VSRRPRVALALSGPPLRDALFSDRLRARLQQLADCDLDAVVTDFSAPPLDLSPVEVLLTGWGCPRIDGAALARLPRLELIAHAAGTVKGHVDPVCWDRGIAVTTAASANAVPVAEFTLAQIILAGKATLTASHLYRERRAKVGRADLPVIGNYDRTVGIIGASTIGRLVIDRLQDLDLDVVVADPTITADEAAELGATLVGLDELMGISDVVSLHAPVLPSTLNMIGAAQLARMRDGATFLNTARGRLVDHDALRAELASGRINAVLDVTEPEPLEPGDVLYTLPNVQLTPHIAGSMGTELHRMTALALDEIEHLTAGTPLRHPVSRQDLDRMA